MKKILCILVLLTVLATAAFAESSVEYANRTDIFTFAPGSSYHASDLFANFKNVLPGDTLTQKVRVRNTSKLDVRVWLQQDEPTQVLTDAEDFLEQLRLTVKQGAKVLFDAPASESAGLTEPVLLGLFKRNGQSSAELEVTLSVPIALDNKYMNQIGVVPWTFIVEEIPDDDSPHTGDWYESGVWLAMAGALLLAIVVVLVLMRRRRAAE